MNKMFSMPVIPEESRRYSITQLIAEVLRKLGFDGILFDSSLTPKNNLISFNAVDFSYIKGSGRAYVINRVKYSHSLTPFELKKDTSYGEIFYWRM